MKMKEIVKNIHILTITKESNTLNWPLVSTEYKNTPCIYYIIYNDNVVKVGQSKNVCSRFGAYRTEIKKYPNHSNNGSWRTVKFLYEKMNVGEKAKIYAWFVKPKKQFEVHNNRQVPVTVDLIKLETLERKKYNSLLG